VFPPEALTFFRGLAKNNNRDWFQPRKEIFEAKVKVPMIELVERMNAELGKFAPEYINDPKKAIYRIYRDTRFSSDKTPYKTHLAAIFPRRGSESKHAGPGFFFAVSHKSIEIAGGVYGPAPEDLLKIRTWLAENHAAFRKIARGPLKVVGELRGSSLTRVPKGFDAAHPAADLIKMKQWFYAAELDAKLATTPKLLPELVKRFKAMAPVMEELAKPLASRKAWRADFNPRGA
jgi:uncharacterized protein (TIGR02453 family)